jgi:periplasmic protein CpxP/Spy
MLSDEIKNAIKSELTQFGSNLNLSDEQKSRLKTALENAREKLEDMRKDNPNISKADMISKLKEARAPLRERISSFLNPDQLSKWDAEVAKAKSFLGYSS